MRGVRNPGNFQITRVPFRYEVETARTSAGLTIAQLDLTAQNLGTRGAAVSENFEFFRVVELDIYSGTDICQGDNGTVTAGFYGKQGIAFVNTALALQVAPTTIPLMAQHQHFVMGGLWDKLKLRITRKDLLQQPMKWYQTFNTGSPDASELSIGTLTYFLETGGAGISAGLRCEQYVVFEGIMELHTPLDYNLTGVRVPVGVASDPAVQKAIAKLRDALDDAAESTRRPPKL